MILHSPLFPGRILLLAVLPMAALGQSPATQPARPGPTAAALKNPLMRGQDPSVVWRDGTFTLVQSSGPSVFLSQAATIAGLATAQRQKAWTATAPMNRDVWAPDLAWVPDAGPDKLGRWYIYVAADDGDNAHHRLFALESNSADATQGFMLKAQVAPPGVDRWAIDASLLQVPTGGERKLYLVWSGWEGEKNVSQHLYIAPMSNPWTIAGGRVKISSPDQPWEIKSGPSPCLVNEGPQAIVHEGRVILTYSANGVWSDEYCLGLLTCDAAKVLDPSAWKKQGPVFAGTNEVFAPGHNCLVEVPFGPEAGWWLMYHGLALPGQNGHGRQLYAQPFAWDDSGFPVFGKPVLAPVHR